ncbi:Aminomethyltransferase, mitochondrial [Nymphon striatum]|nr:Aminomethyltransferase, mitochondrial [Nymphon striatum]
MSDLLHTALHDLHVELGAKMVPFAGYSMPVQYPLGVMGEHTHCRAKAGLFDVSHMGQVIVKGRDYATAAQALETLIPVDVLGLADGRQRYGFFTNDTGGIMDDLMLANRGDHILVVVNAACKIADIAHMKANLDVEVVEVTDRALLALQGPAAEGVLSALDPRAAQMRFMDVATLSIAGTEAWVSRSGYTGEDGYEISIPNDAAVDVARALLTHNDVEPIGLGARDSLRLEAGLCLYGQDMDAGLNPVEASLSWAIQKVRRTDGTRAAGFPGAEVVLSSLDDGVGRRRVGLKPEGRAPMRQGVPLFEHAEGGTQIGFVTSGGFGPSVGGPVAMGIVADSLHSIGTTLYGELRGKQHEWLRDEDGLIVVGITEHATTQLGDIVFVELPEVGDTVVKDEEIVVIESVKAASDIMAPIDGEIVEVNDALTDNPGLANEDAIGDGWFFKIKPSDPSQMDNMMDEAAYNKLIA